MTSETIRHPQTDHLLTPENAALIIIDYQPVQVSSIRSMSRKELVFNIVSTAKAALNYSLPIIHSTVNVQTGRNQAPIQCTVNSSATGRATRPCQASWACSTTSTASMPSRRWPKPRKNQRPPTTGQRWP